MRDRPGDDALWTFEENGDGSLKCLVTTAAWICGPLDGVDPAVELEGLRQLKGESFRKFGLTLRRLAKEAFKGLSPSEPWLVRKVSGLFIDGLEDEDMSRELAYRWSTEMSLNDLFIIAEDIKRKKVLLRTPAVPVNQGSVRVCTAEDSLWDAASSASDPESMAVAAMDSASSRGGFQGRRRDRGRGGHRGESKMVGDAALSLELVQAIEKIIEKLCVRKEDKGRGTPSNLLQNVGKEGRSRGTDAMLCLSEGQTLGS